MYSVCEADGVFSVYTNTIIIDNNIVYLSSYCGDFIVTYMVIFS